MAINRKSRGRIFTIFILSQEQRETCRALVHLLTAIGPTACCQNHAWLYARKAVRPKK
jgi:hypothetical protein